MWHMCDWLHALVDECDCIISSLVHILIFAHVLTLDLMPWSGCDDPVVVSGEQISTLVVQICEHDGHGAFGVWSDLPFLHSVLHLCMPVIMWLTLIIVELFILLSSYLGM